MFSLLLRFVFEATSGGASRLAPIPHVLSAPAPDVEILQFTPGVPVGPP